MIKSLIDSQTHGVSCSYPSLLIFIWVSGQIPVGCYHMEVSGGTMCQLQISAKAGQEWENPSTVCTQSNCQFNRVKVSDDFNLLKHWSRNADVDRIEQL